MGRAGSALKQVLETYKISQNRLATALQVERSVVNRWFHGQVDPNGETIVAIVQALRTLNATAAERFIQLYLGDLMRPTNATVQLRPSQPADLDFVLAAEQHPDNSPYVWQWSREQHLAALTHPDIAHLIIEVPTRQTPVGYVILIGLQNPNQSIQLCRIVIEVKNQGYGKATLKQVKQLAFQTYNAHRLWLDVKVGNDRAQAVYHDAGFIIEGTFRDYVKTPQGYDSYRIMSLLRPEYQP